MSSEQPRRIVDDARHRGERAFRRAYGSVSQQMGAEPGVRGPSVFDLVGEGGAGAVGRARDIAVLMLRTAATIAEGCVDSAEELESILTGHPLSDRAGSAPKPDGEATAAVAPVALVLPAVSPGGETSVAFEVRNDSRDMIDAMRLRCGGLFGADDLRIASLDVTFTPPTLDVPPRSRVQVICQVNVPASAKLGHYVGLIEARGLTGVQLLVSLDVV